jgi:hypothetical protein
MHLVSGIVQNILSQNCAFKETSVGWKKSYPEIFSFCLIMDFVKPHKISAHSDRRMK